MLNSLETTQTTSWYALRCKPNFEFIVADQLSGKNVSNYLPAIEAKSVNPRSRGKKPYFPGYLFVNGDLADLYSSRIGLLRGAIGLVSFDETPASIPEPVLNLVRKQVLIESQRINPDPAEFKTGDPVEIDDPLLQGIEARFESCLNGEDRVAVLLTLLEGRSLRVEVPAAKVKKQKK